MLLMTSRTYCITLFTLLTIGLLALPAASCPIPVYQYSLEWWERDAYEVYVFDTGELTEEQEASIARLQRISEGRREAEPANLRLRRVQHESEERLAAHSALRGAEIESLPWMVVYYPAVSSNRSGPIWMGPLTEENIDALIDSPKRQEISDLLLNRTSVVWVLLESGNGRADREAAEVLEREVKRLEETLVPPALDEWGMEDIEISDIKFEIRRLSQNDETERMFVAMLTNSEIDLDDYRHEPMVFPIFGRGLIMNALIGRGINANMLRRTAEFLTGPCSCTVKSLNPGTDLLTTADWSGRIQPLSVEVTTEPGGLGGFLDSAEEAEAFQER